MNKIFTQFRVVLLCGCLVLLSGVVLLISFSEKSIDASRLEDHTPVEPAIDKSPSLEANTEFLDELRLAYSDLKSVEMVSNVSIRIFREGKTISGDAVIRYIAKGDKYRYEVSIPENLAKEGLMPSSVFAWNGKRFYNFDIPDQLISFQSEESKHLPSLPNPFFIPLEFLSPSDDECINCKLRLQDLKSPERWPERKTKLREIQSERTDGLVNDLLTTSGGKIRGQAVDYMIRIVGQAQGEHQINSISMTGTDGRRLADLVFAKFESVDGLRVKVPKGISFSAVNEKGMPELNAEFRISIILGLS